MQITSAPEADRPETNHHLVTLSLSNIAGYHFNVTLNAFYPAT